MNTELRRNLSDNPVIALVGLVDWVPKLTALLVLVWLATQSVVDTENWHSQLSTPLAQLKLRLLTGLRRVSSRVKVYNHFGDFLTRYLLLHRPTIILRDVQPRVNCFLREVYTVV